MNRDQLFVSHFYGFSLLQHRSRSLPDSKIFLTILSQCTDVSGVTNKVTPPPCQSLPEKEQLQCLLPTKNTNSSNQKHNHRNGENPTPKRHHAAAAASSPLHHRSRHRSTVVALSRHRRGLSRRLTVAGSLASPSQALAAPLRALSSSWPWAPSWVRDLIDTQKVEAIIGPDTWKETTLVADICSQNHVLAIPPLSSSSLPQELEKLRNGYCRVLLLICQFLWAINLFQTAKKLKMMEKGYVWIVTDPLTNLVHSLNSSTISSMQGIVGVKSYFPEIGLQYEDFYSKFRKKFSLENPHELNNEPGIFAARAYDAAWTLALSMIQTTNKKDQTLLDKIINVMGKDYKKIWVLDKGTRFLKYYRPKCCFQFFNEELGQVLWPGRPWGIPRGWIPALDKPLRIGVPVLATLKQSVTVIHDQTENTTTFQGFTIDLFRETMELLPYHLPYKFYPFNDTYDNLVKQVYLKNPNFPNQNSDPNFSSVSPLPSPSFPLCNPSFLHSRLPPFFSYNPSFIHSPLPQLHHSLTTLFSPPSPKRYWFLGFWHSEVEAAVGPATYPKTVPTAKKRESSQWCGESL
ncbi:glutamate receptor 3.6-like [Vigna umbellata]|uniref:glutamate receptor 3.6-like n=1 Tax=Vigna umbellata TaxID=87088 RepID=UPI001F5E462F|nr:glutamate receptor 3.6-like [Vigna umbellata]